MGGKRQCEKVKKSKENFRIFHLFPLFERGRKWGKEKLERIHMGPHNKSIKPWLEDGSEIRKLVT